MVLLTRWYYISFVPSEKERRGVQPTTASSPFVLTTVRRQRLVFSGLSPVTGRLSYGKSITTFNIHLFAHPGSLSMIHPRPKASPMCSSHWSTLSGPQEDSRVSHDARGPQRHTQCSLRRGIANSTRWGASCSKSSVHLTLFVRTILALYVVRFVGAIALLSRPLQQGAGSLATMLLSFPCILLPGIHFIPLGRIVFRDPYLSSLVLLRGSRNILYLIIYFSTHPALNHPRLPSSILHLPFPPFLIPINWPQQP